MFQTAHTHTHWPNPATLLSVFTLYPPLTCSPLTTVTFLNFFHTHLSKLLYWGIYIWYPFCLEYNSSTYFIIHYISLKPLLKYDLNIFLSILNKNNQDNGLHFILWYFCFSLSWIIASWNTCLCVSGHQPPTLEGK